MGLFSFLFEKKDNSTIINAIKDGALLVDVRTTSEFSSGSVNGAINIPLDKVAHQISKFKNKKAIIVFCRSGNRSSQAKSILERNGIHNVINGGTWQNVRNIKEEASK